MRPYLIAAACACILVSGCGGGGSTGGGSSVPPPASVSGDMLALAQSRGWNYQGSSKGTAVTITLYADPASGGVTPLVALAVLGSQPDATAGTKTTTLSITGGLSGYDVTAYTFFNMDGTVFTSGGLPAGSVLVPGTLTQGQSFTPYPGMTATVSSVGSVPGTSGCPTPATGATVQYAFMGQNYSISYVPGCGLTQFVGNQGETFTLISVGSYPQLGTLGIVRQTKSLTVMDAISSAARVLLEHRKWHSIFSH